MEGTKLVQLIIILIIVVMPIRLLWIISHPKTNDLVEEKGMKIRKMVTLVVGALIFTMAVSLFCVAVSSYWKYANTRSYWHTETSSVGDCPSKSPALD